MAEGGEGGRGHFVFVNMHDPQQPSGHRRVVRSRAAAYSHRMAPRKGKKANREAAAGIKTEIEISPESSDHSPGETSRTSSIGSGGPLLSTDEKPLPVRGRKSRPPTRPPTPGQSLTGSPPRGRVAKRQNTSDLLTRRCPTPRLPVARDQDIDPRLAAQSLVTTFQLEPPKPVNVKTEPTDDSNPPSLVHTSLAQGSRDPFNTYPGYRDASFDWLTDHWYKGVLPKAKALIKTSQEAIDAYCIWSRRMEMSEPALYYIGLFLATGIPVSQGKFPLYAAIWLRGQAVKTLQDALNDPVRAFSTPVILAVGRVALHEHIYGDRELCHEVHRPAQQRMITARGGIGKLGLPNLTIQMMVWYDALMAAESGTKAYFAEVMPYLTSKGIASFTPEEAISVTKCTSPNRYQHPGYATVSTKELSPRQLVELAD